MSEPLSEKDKEPGTPQTPPANPEPPVTPPADPNPPTPPAVPPGYVPATELEKLRAEYEDIKEKYGESSKEALLWRERYNKRLEREQDINNQPTEQEMRDAYGPAWEEMTDEGKLIATRQYADGKIARRLLSEREAEQAERDFNRLVESTITADPELEGREEPFREYCRRPTHRGVAMDILVKAFKHEVPAPTPAAPVRSGFENPNGGPRNPANPRAKYTASEALALQRSNPKKYTELLMKGEFDEFVPE